jgi:adhesin transport system outer membrane protein
MRAFLLSCLAALAFAALPAAAADMTVRQLLAKVVADDPQVAVRRANIRAVDADRRVTQSALYPSVDLSTQTGRAERKDLPAPSPFSANDGFSRPANSTSLTVTQLLFDAGKGATQLKIAQLNVEREKIALRKTADERVLAALSAALDVVAQRKKLDQARATESRLVHLESLVEGRLRSGQAPLVELRRAQSRLLDQRRVVAEADGSLRQAEQRFFIVTGLPSAQVDFTSMPDALPDNAQIEQLRSACATRCIDVADAQLVLQAGRLDASTTTSNYLPKVVLQASATRSMNSTGAVEHYASRSVWVVATWNLFSGGGDVARQRAAYERLAASESQLQAVVQQATGDFERVRQDYLTGIDVERLARSAADVAADTRALAERGYEAGVRPLLDVADTLVEESRAEANVVDAAVKKKLALYQLLTLTGDLAAHMGADMGL